ncbi:MAG: SoxR reducing system RseC family protein [Bacteroidales bacterium]|nr:SoxR reducing system RseC family protein [Bacteroidales bacterium]
MESRSTVTHDGIVEMIEGSHVRIRFVAQSACAACHARGVCSISNTEEKFVDIEDSRIDLSVGEHVEVVLEQRHGYKAVLFGYGLPLIVLLAVLISVLAVTQREGLSALIGIGSLVPYYLIIYLFRKKIGKSIEFRIRKTD